MSGPPTFSEIWRLQWVENSTLDDWRAKGALVKTPAELEKVIDHAAKRGFELGEQRGRFNLRRDIEAGTVAPITPTQQPDKEPQS